MGILALWTRSEMIGSALDQLCFLVSGVGCQEIQTVISYETPQFDVSMLLCPGHFGSQLLCWTLTSDLFLHAPSPLPHASVSWPLRWPTARLNTDLRPLLHAPCPLLHASLSWHPTPETDQTGCEFIKGKIEILIRKRSTKLSVSEWTNFVKTCYALNRDMVE